MSRTTDVREHDRETKSGRSIVNRHKRRISRQQKETDRYSRRSLSRPDLDKWMKYDSSEEWGEDWEDWFIADMDSPPNWLSQWIDYEYPDSTSYTYETEYDDNDDPILDDDGEPVRTKNEREFTQHWEIFPEFRDGRKILRVGMWVERRVDLDSDHENWRFLMKKDEISQERQKQKIRSD